MSPTMTDREIRRQLVEIDRELARQNRLLRAALATCPDVAAQFARHASFQLVAPPAGSPVVLHGARA